MYLHFLSDHDKMIWYTVGQLSAGLSNVTVKETHQEIRDAQLYRGKRDHDPPSRLY